MKKTAKYLLLYVILFLLCHDMFAQKYADATDRIILVISTTRAQGAQIVTVNHDEVLQLYICKGSDLLTGVDVISGAVFDANKVKIMDIEFVDNGDISKGDAKAMDGIYSTVIKFPKEGLYSIEATLDLKDFPLRVTRLSLMPPSGGLKSFVRLEDPFNVTFSQTATLSVVADQSVEPLSFPTAAPDFDPDAEDDDDVIYASSYSDPEAI